EDLGSLPRFQLRWLIVILHGTPSQKNRIPSHRRQGDMLLWDLGLETINRLNRLGHEPVMPAQAGAEVVSPILQSLARRTVGHPFVGDVGERVLRYLRKYIRYFAEEIRKAGHVSPVPPPLAERHLSSLMPSGWPDAAAL